tara:strand:+ start:234 stop:1367 length:1134 start_codon:yes stop_codon:yes gene_type:complete
MKILLPYLQQNSHYAELERKNFLNDVVTTGQSWFAKMIYKNFDDVTVKFVNNIKSKELRENPKISKEICNSIKKKANEINADVIICNNFQSYISGASVVDSNIPIMYVCHENRASMSCIKHMKRLKKNNHSVFLVNEFQKNYYDAYAKRLNSDLISFDGFVEPAYLEGEKPKINNEVEFDCVTIGRCSPKYKMPYRLKSMLKDTEFKTLLMSNVKNLDSESEDGKVQYYEKNKHWKDCLYDLPHEEVIKNLTKSRTYFMTWEDECFPVVGLEALSCGVPLILNSRMTDDRGPVKRQNFKYPLHGGDKWATNKSYYKNIKHNSREELINAINSFKDIDRKEIQDMTWEKYTQVRWKKIISNAIDKTIDNFNKTSIMDI